MPDNRNLKLDLFALFLLAVVLFLAVALTTYDPADPVPRMAAPLSSWYTPDVTVFPQHDEPVNACGRWGAMISDFLLNGLGVCAYYVLISLAILDAWLLQRRPIDAPIIRLLGWLASLVGIAAIASLAVPGFSPGPFIGAGGYLGALATTVLQQHFATLGSLILCTSLVIGGWLLCTDYVLLRGVSLIALAVSRAFRLVLRGLLGIRRSTEPASEISGGTGGLHEPNDEEEGEDELSVRIRGKKLSRSAPHSEDELEDELFTSDEGLEDGDEDFDADDEVATEEDAAEEEEEAAVANTRTLSDGAVVRGDDEHPPQEPRVRKRRSASERELVMSSLNAASLVPEAADYELPSIDLLIQEEEVDFEAQAKEVRRKAKILEQTFADFGYQVKVVEIETGPVIAQYEVQLEAGLRLSKITGLADDLAIALRVPSVRIVAPIPGKNTVGIEVPNSERQIVRLREVLEESQPKAQKMRIPLFLGKDVSGSPLAVDLSTLPHLLIAGRTGTGKSVCLNAIICSMLMTRRPDEVRLLLIDPKMVELSCYGRLPHLMHPVVTDMRKAEAILAWAVEKMEERYALLARAGVRHISSYNQLSEEELMERLDPQSDEERKNIPLHLPFIVIVADEMADLMMTAGKEVEQHIIRLAQKSRAVGIHLILATQKPTVDVITGLIKSNLPARISFQVASRTDSRVVLDEMGADKLLGNGDMLFLWPGTSMLLRGQGTYVSDEEIEAIVDAVSTGEQNFVHELVNMQVRDSADTEGGAWKQRDELYEQAIDVIVREGRGSVSLLQRALGIGYGRAARLIDFMEEDGIVGAYAGSQAREVIISMDDWERMRKTATAAAAPASTPTLPAPRRTNRIRPTASGWDDDASPTGKRNAPSSRHARKATADVDDDSADLESDAYDTDDESDVDRLDDTPEDEVLDDDDDDVESDHLDDDDVDCEDEFDDEDDRYDEDEDVDEEFDLEPDDEEFEESDYEEDALTEDVESTSESDDDAPWDDDDIAYHDAEEALMDDALSAEQEERDDEGAGSWDRSDEDDGESESSADRTGPRRPSGKRSRHRSSRSKRNSGGRRQRPSGPARPFKAESA